MALNFEWDEEKAEANLHKHRVSFNESRTVFGDLFSITIPDRLHSEGERRLIAIGRSESGRLLVVCYTEREHPPHQLASGDEGRKEDL